MQVLSELSTESQHHLNYIGSIAYGELLQSFISQSWFQNSLQQEVNNATWLTNTHLNYDSPNLTLTYTSKEVLR